MGFNKRILLLSTCHEGAGIGKYAFELSRALLSLGVPSDLLLYFRFLLRNANRRVPQPSRFSLPRMVLDSFKLNGLSRSYALCHMCTPTAFDPLYNPRVTPTVTTFHDLGGQRVPFSPPSRFVLLRWALAKRCIKGRLKKIAKTRCHIITPTRYLKTQIMKAVEIEPYRIHVIPYGVNHSLFRPRAKDKARRCIGLPLDVPVVLNVSSTHLNKNVSGVLSVFSEICRRTEAVRFLRVGGLTREQQAIASGLGKRLQIRSQVDPWEMPFYYNSADCYVHLSLDDGASFPLIEAMTAGIPVVASNVPPIPEVTGDAAILVNPADHAAVANTVLEVLHNDTLRKEMVRRGLDLAKNFTWTNCALQTLRVYDYALGVT